MIHDATVDRTTNGTGAVSQLTFDELRRLDAGSWKSDRFAGERLPTLEEVFAAVPRDRWMNINIKGAPWVSVEVARKLEAHGRVNGAVLAVAENGAAAAREAVPGIWTCPLDRKLTRKGYIDSALAFGADFIQLHVTRGTPTGVELARLRAAGIRINFCCVDSVAEAGELIEAGVDFPLVDQLTGDAADWLVVEAPGDGPPTGRTPGPATAPARRE